MSEIEKAIGRIEARVDYLSGTMSKQQSDALIIGRSILDSCRLTTQSFEQTLNNLQEMKI